MFIRSFRFKNILLVCGIALIGLALGAGVLFLGAGAAKGEDPESEQRLEQTESGASDGEPSAPEPGQGGASIPETSSLPEAPAAPDSEEKIVYLTFDDGPSVITAEILDVLKERQVPATFFVIGATTERGQSLYRRIVEEGHSLGIHSYSHRYHQIYQSAENYLKDFDQLADHLESITGVRPNIFRFPGGSNNRHAEKAVLDEIKAAMEQRGAAWFDWNAVAKDAGSKATPAETMFETITKTAGDQNQILILMHDDTIRTTAAQCVEMLIDHYQALGYRFEKLTADVPPIHLKD